MKKYFIGFIVGLAIAISIPFVNANNEILAQFTDFNFIVNGRNIQLETKPLVYNGTSYLPVRELSNILGYDVTYKADSRTIVLDNQNLAVPEVPYTPSVPVDPDISGDTKNNQNTSEVKKEIPTIRYNGKEYILLEDFNNTYIGYSFSLYTTDNPFKTSLVFTKKEINKDAEILIYDVVREEILYNNSLIGAIPLEYFKTVIYPMIK